MDDYLSWRTWDEAEPELRRELPEPALSAVRRAAEAAARWHGTQTRPTGAPYTEHLLEALEVLVRGAGERDPDVLAAALLHDVVEDTPATVADVEAEFGPVVAEYVDWLTKPPVRSKKEKRAAKVGYLRRLRDAPPQVVSIKLADRASNVQTLDRMPPDFQRRYYTETVVYVMPLAEEHPFFAPWFAGWAQRFAHLR